MKQLTVFMPVYNAEKYLKESLDSILNQSFKEFDLLIIDDGSTDNSINIIESYKDERIKLLQNEKNEGLPYTRNRALKTIDTKYIALMDADDIASKNRLSSQYNYLENNFDVVAVFSNVNELCGNKIKKSRKSINFKNLTLENEIWDIKLTTGNIFANPTAMFRNLDVQYRKECFVAQDYSYWIDFKQKGKFHVINEALLLYRTGHENITKKSKRNRKSERNELLDNIRNRALTNCLFTLNKDEINNFNYIFNENKEINDFKESMQFINTLNSILRGNKIYKDEIVKNIYRLEFIKVIMKSKKINIYNKLKLCLTKVEKETNVELLKSYLRMFEYYVVRGI